MQPWGQMCMHRCSSLLLLVFWRGFGTCGSRSGCCSYACSPVAVTKRTTCCSGSCGNSKWRGDVAVPTIGAECIERDDAIESWVYWCELPVVWSCLSGLPALSTWVAGQKSLSCAASFLAEDDVKSWSRSTVKFDWSGVGLTRLDESEVIPGQGVASCQGFSGAVLKCVTFSCGCSSVLPYQHLKYIYRSSKQRTKRSCSWREMFAMTQHCFETWGPPVVQPFVLSVWTSDTVAWATSRSR